MISFPDGRAFIAGLWLGGYQAFVRDNTPSIEAVTVAADEYTQSYFLISDKIIVPQRRMGGSLTQQNPAGCEQQNTEISGSKPVQAGRCSEDENKTHLVNSKANSISDHVRKANITCQKGRAHWKAEAEGDKITST